MQTTNNIHRRFVRPGLTVTVLGGALAIAGCNQAQNTGTAQAKGSHKGSDRKEAHTMNGHADHHTSTNELKAQPKAHAPITRFEFESKPEQLAAGQSATWTLRVLDAKIGQPVRELDTVHDKLIHLFVVSKDLSFFNHVHPEYQGNGTFTLKTTLPRAGDYKLYADYTPKGGQQEVPQHEISVRGDNPLPTSVSLTAASPQKGGWMTTRVTAHPEDRADIKGGPAYEVALMPMPGQLKSGKEAMLHFQVRDSKGQPLKDLQPYLGAMGHAFILSSDAKRYLHAHPMEAGMSHDMKGADQKAHDKHKGHGEHGAQNQGGGSDVIFHTTFPTPGLYKAWGQFKHQGKIITASFVVNVVQGDAPRATQSPSDAHDESKPHSH
jgi:hypothetical protein